MITDNITPTKLLSNKLISSNTELYLASKSNKTVNFEFQTASRTICFFLSTMLSIPFTIAIHFPTKMVLIYASSIINPFPNKAWLLCVCIRKISKTLREKEKLLVTSNFSFSHNVFSYFGQLIAILIKLKIVVCKLFQFGRV